MDVTSLDEGPATIEDITSNDVTFENALEEALNGTSDIEKSNIDLLLSSPVFKNCFLKSLPVIIAYRKKKEAELLIEFEIQQAKTKDQNSSTRTQSQISGTNDIEVDHYSQKSVDTDTTQVFTGSAVFVSSQAEDLLINIPSTTSTQIIENLDVSMEITENKESNSDMSQDVSFIPTNNLATVTAPISHEVIPVSFVAAPLSPGVISVQDLTKSLLEAVHVSSLSTTTTTTTTTTPSTTTTAAATTTTTTTAAATTTTPPPPTPPSESLKDLFLNMVTECRRKLATSTHPLVESVKICFDNTATELVAEFKDKEADQIIHSKAMISLLARYPNTIFVSNLVQELKVSCAMKATELEKSSLFGIEVTNLSFNTFPELIDYASQQFTTFGMVRQDIDKIASKAAVDKQIANAIEKTKKLNKPMPRHEDGTVYMYYGGIKVRDKDGTFLTKTLEITYGGSNTQAGLTTTESEKARTNKRKADIDKTNTDSLTRWARERRAKAIKNGDDPNDVWLTRISMSVRIPEGSLTILGDAFGVTQVMEAETIQLLKLYDMNINKREVTVGFQGMTSSEAKRIQCYIKCSKGYKLEEYYNKEKVIETLNETGTTGWIISATGVVTLPDVLVNKGTFNIDNVIAAFDKIPGKSVFLSDIGKLNAGHSISQQKEGFFKIKVEVTCNEFVKVEVQATLNKEKQGQYQAFISVDDFGKLPEVFKKACPKRKFHVRQAVSNQGFEIAGNTLTDILKVTAWTSVPPSFIKETDTLVWIKMKSSKEKGGKKYSTETLTLHYKSQTITATYRQNSKNTFFVTIPLRSRSAVNKGTANPELVEAISALKEVTDKKWRYYTTNLLELPPNLKNFRITKP